MLIQRTVTRVGAQSQAQHLFRTLRSLSNLNLAICLAEMPANNAMTLSDDPWGSLFLPTDITFTFETCNISRAYKLEVRLGFKSGPQKVYPMSHNLNHDRWPYYWILFIIDTDAHIRSLVCDTLYGNLR